MHKKLIKDIIETNDPEIMKALECEVTKMLDEIKHKDKEEYKRIEFKLYKIVHGEHLDEHLSKKWVDKMKNKDGTIGEHWTLEQTSQFAGTYDKYDFYAILNMMYSDYYSPKFDTSTYVSLAKDWLDDKDAGHGKALKYYMYIVDCD